MRVAAYIRVSTDEQVEKGNSLNEQQERLTAYCRSRGWSEPVFFVDDGYSAKDLNRPAAQKMLKKVEEFDVVLTTKLDRMSRNLLDMLQTVNHLERHDCQFISASEGFDTSTAVGKMVMQLLAVFAEFERGRISERVKENMLSIAKHTTKALGKSVYGLLVKNKEYVLSPKEVPVIEMMADLVEQGHGLRGVSIKLNDKGYRTRKGKLWDQRTVKRVLTNPAISGTMIFNMRDTTDGKIVMRDKEEWIVKEGNHPAIITPERQKRIISILESRKPARKHADSETYLLSGILRCGHCNRLMVGSTARIRRKDKKYDYYRYICKSYMLGFGCKYHAVHREDIEPEIIKELQQIVETDPSELDVEIAPSAIAKNEIEELNTQLAKIDRRMQKQIEAYGDDLISAADLKIASEKAEKQRTEIKQRLETIEKHRPEIQEAQKTAKELLPVILGEDRVKAKAAIRSVIESIELLDGSTGRVVLRSLV